MSERASVRKALIPFLAVGSERGLDCVKKERGRNRARVFECSAAARTPPAARGESSPP